MSFSGKRLGFGGCGTGVRSGTLFPSWPGSTEHTFLTSASSSTRTALANNALPSSRLLLVPGEMGNVQILWKTPQKYKKSFSRKKQLLIYKRGEGMKTLGHQRKVLRQWFLLHASRVKKRKNPKSQSNKHANETSL